MLELADAVIVGGGIMGAALAAALSRRLSRVLLLEAERCGGKATSGGFAWINASSKWENEHYHRLNAEACRHHIALAAEWGSNRTGWHGGGSLFWTTQNDASRESSLNLRARAAQLHSWGYPLTTLAKGEMESLEPTVTFPDDASGLFAPSEGWVETARLMRFFVDQARGNRVDIREFTHVTGFTRDYTGGIATVETSRGRVSTGALIIAAGTESARLAALVTEGEVSPPRFQMHSSLGLLLEIEMPSDSFLVHRVCYPPDAAGLHLRPTPEGGLLAGADDTDALSQEAEMPLLSTGAAMPEWDLSDASSQDAQARLLERVHRLLPESKAMTGARVRRCVRPLPPDGLPLAGPLPGVRGVYLLASHSGVTLGPLLAQLLAEEILTGRQPAQLAPYRPARLRA